MSAYAAWIALGLWFLSFAFFGAVFVQLRRFWRQHSATVQPLLALLAPPPPTVARCGFVVDVGAGIVESCTRDAGHDGAHRIERT